MSVLVDTSVWSLALRRNRRDLNPLERRIVFRCRELAIAGEAALIGPIVQETLSGISDAGIFEKVRERLELVGEMGVDAECYVLAASYFNICRAAGVAPGTIDMTICAAAYLHGASVFTTDPDFGRYANYLPIQLFEY